MASKSELGDLEAFCQVATYGGFTAAARSVECPKSSLSLAVRRLESRLGVRLIERTTRRIHLTHRGHQLLEEAGPLFSRLHYITDETRSMSGQISGTLRIAAPYEFGAYHVAVAAEALIAKHPDLRVTIDVQYAPVADLFAQGYDMVFTMSNGVLPDSGAVSCKLFSLPRGLFAAPSFLNNRRRLSAPRDLAGVPVIASPQDGEWRFTRAGESDVSVPIKDCVICSSNADVRRGAAIAGLGVTRVTATFCEQAVAEGKLVPVLSRYTSTPLHVYGLVSDRRLMPEKVRALFNVLKAD